MADDWIKWVKGLEKRREVIFMARRLIVDPRMMASVCMEFWAWADGETRNGKIKGVSPEDVDAIVRVPGFASAMSCEEVRWLSFKNGCVFIVKWSHHNGDSAKQRAMDNRKKRRQRELEKDAASGKRPGPIGTKTGPEKRREDKSLTSDHLRSFLREIELKHGLIPPDARARNFMAWAFQVIPQAQLAGAASQAARVATSNPWGYFHRTLIDEAAKRGQTYGEPNGKHEAQAAAQ